MSLLRHWFANPWALWLLVLLPALGILATLARRRRRWCLAQLASRPTLAALTTGRRRFRALGALGSSMGLALLIAGIAGPQWGRDREQQMALGRDLVVVLDLSRSMLADDVVGNASPNRLGRARDALADLADEVQRRGGHRLALVVFAARAKVVCPLTRDYDHFREALANLDPADPLLEIGPGPEGPASGTRIGEGLRLAARTHEPRYHGHQDILLISDGDDPAQDEEWRAGIAAALEADIPVHTVGIGDPDNGGRIPQGSGYFLYNGQEVRTRLQEKPLEQIARRTRGIYTPARTKALPLGELFTEQLAARPGHEDQEDVLPAYHQHYEWFFGGALVVLSMEVLLSAGSLWPGRGKRKVKAKTTKAGSQP